MSNTEARDVLAEAFAKFALEEMEFEDRQKGAFTYGAQDFTGTLLGFGTSRDMEDTHKHAPGTVPTSRCSACRWAEVAIFKTIGSNDKPIYLVMTMGKSVVPGDEVRVSETWTPNPVEVLRSMAVSQPAGKRGERGEVHSSYRRIPVCNAVAFRYAAEVDKDIEAVLDEYDDAVPMMPADEDQGLGQRF